MRLLSTMYYDVLLQLRNGFYYATALIGLLIVTLLSQLTPELLRLILPILVFFNLMTNTFYFLGGLVLLEKGEGTLEAQIVTPLRVSEYLASKIITLSVLATVENLLIVGLVYGLNLAWLPLIIGLLLAGVIYALVGFLAVVRYDSINEYLIPSSFYLVVASVPLLPYVGLGTNPLFYLHPLHGPLLLIQAMFQPISLAQWAYSLLYPIGGIVLLGIVCQRHFARFIITKEGVSA